MPFGFLGGLIGPIIGGASSLGAASIQANAANQAAQLQQQEWDQTQQNLLPFLQAGQQMLPQLTGLLQPGGQLRTSPLPGPIPSYNMPAFTAQMYQQSPGYAATMQGGTQALQNAGATKTGALSGNTLRALQGYGTGLANADYQQGYNNYAANYQNQFGANNANFWHTYDANNQQNQNLFNWLQTIVGSGQNAGAQLGALGNSAVSNMGNALIGAGNAQAAGLVGAGNNLSSGFNSMATQQALGGTSPNSNSLAALQYGQGGYGLSGGDLSFLDSAASYYGA